MWIYKQLRGKQLRGYISTKLERDVNLDKNQSCGEEIDILNKK